MEYELTQGLRLLFNVERYLVNQHISPTSCLCSVHFPRVRHRNGFLRGYYTTNYTIINGGVVRALRRRMYDKFTGLVSVNLITQPTSEINMLVTVSYDYGYGALNSFIAYTSIDKVRRLFGENRLSVWWDVMQDLWDYYRRSP